MGSIFSLYQGANTIAIAGIYHLPSDFKEFKLSEFIRIVPANEEIEKLYIPRLAKDTIKPSHYIIGISSDKRYWSTSRKVDDCHDAESSITLAHLSICIFYMLPYYLGPVFGFNSEGSPCALGISKPSIAGLHGELEDAILHPAVSPLVGISSFSRCQFSSELADFFKKVCKAYSEIKDERWLLAAFKYLSGITQYHAYDAILDFSVAIESLVNRGEQVSFAARYYLSLLSGDNYKERVRIERDVQNFYSLRSKLVHGSGYNINENNKEMIVNISKCIAKALINTCGKRIEKEVFTELNYMSFLGCPSYCNERINFVVTVEELIETIKSNEHIEKTDSYMAYISEADQNGDCDLLIELNVNGKTIGPFDASDFLWSHPKMVSLTGYSYRISMDEKKNYVFLITEIKNKFQG